MASVYGQTLKKARHIAAVSADSQHHRFLVGTTMLNADNELHLLEYSEEKNDVWCLGIFPHKHEVWHVSPCPTQQDLLFTVYNTGKEFATTLYKVQHPSLDESAKEDDSKLKPLFTIENGAFNSQLHSVLWDPSHTHMDRVITIDSMFIKEWRIEYEQNASFSMADEMDAQRKVTSGKWSPYHSEIVAVGSGNKIVQLDIRTKKTTNSIEAHDAKSNILDLDWNPYSPYHIASASDDSKVKFWDLRKKTEPLRVIAGHSHWVCNVKYNPFNDQLVLTSSTDSLVNLWRLSSIATKPEDDEEETEQPQQPSTAKKPKKHDDKDALVSKIDEHEESVYSVAWSSKNSWVFASVCYNGRVLLHQVPEQEKFRILKID